MQPASPLDSFASKLLKELTTEETDAINEALYAETGIGFSYENFDDFELVIYDADETSTEYLNWPIPGLRTVSQAVALARQLKAANTPPQPASKAIIETWFKPLEAQLITEHGKAEITPEIEQLIGAATHA
ncbi:hypothetical protein [Prosthecobacter sp.]|uniref:hypothetical protein n=1 Tax=Prosthecobacter sp. TaxID=1965333 RepID=UPI00378415B2